MCEITEKIYKDGMTEGKTEQAMNTANAMHKKGFDNATIADILQVSVQKVQEWIAGNGMNLAR